MTAKASNGGEAIQSHGEVTGIDGLQTMVLKVQMPPLFSFFLVSNNQYKRRGGPFI